MPLLGKPCHEQVLVGHPQLYPAQLLLELLWGLHVALVHCSQEVFLAIVVIIDSRLGILDTLSQLIEVESMIAVLPEQIVCMLNDQSFSIGTLSSLSFRCEG